MIEDKQSVGKEYMEHAKNADDMWLAQRMSEGQQKSLCSWIRKIRLKNSWNRKKIWGRKNYRKNSIKTKKVRKVQII